jgi:hypothetical protein
MHERFEIYSTGAGGVDGREELLRLGRQAVPHLLVAALKIQIKIQIKIIRFKF